MSILSKSFSQEAPAVLDEGAWHAELNKNTVWIEYQQTLMFVMNNSHKNLPAERRQAAGATLVAFIAKSANAHTAHELGCQAMEFALTETAFYIEGNKFDIAFLKASLSQPQEKSEQDHIREKIEIKEEQNERYSKENAGMQHARGNLSPEALGAALLTKLVIRAGKEGLTEAGQQAHDTLSKNLDLPQLNAAALASKAAEYFSLPNHLNPAQEKLAAKMAYTFPSIGRKLH